MLVYKHFLKIIKLLKLIAINKLAFFNEIAYNVYTFLAKLSSESNSQRINF